MQNGIVIAARDYDEVCKSDYDYIELAGRSVAAMSDFAFEELKRRIMKGKLPCLGLNAYCPPEVAIIGPKFSRDKAQQYAIQLAQRAHDLGVKIVGIGSPFSRILPSNFSLGEAYDQAASFMRVTSRAFAPYGITVCIEALGPCYCNFINHLDEAERLCRIVEEENLKLVVDFYNMESAGEGDLDLKPYSALIAHAHISDDAGSPLKRSYLKKEKAEIHAARLHKLRETGYGDGCITLEIDVPFEANAAARSLEILKSVY